MPELGKKRNPGILGYDPAKKGSDYSVSYYTCPHCWYTSRSKGAITTHINKEHWNLKDE